MGMFCQKWKSNWNFVGSCFEKEYEFEHWEWMARRNQFTQWIPFYNDDAIVCVCVWSPFLESQRNSSKKSPFIIPMVRNDTNKQEHTTSYYAVSDIPIATFQWPSIYLMTYIIHVVYRHLAHTFALTACPNGDNQSNRIQNEHVFVCSIRTADSRVFSLHCKRQAAKWQAYSSYILIAHIKPRNRNNVCDSICARTRTHSHTQTPNNHSRLLSNPAKYLSSFAFVFRFTQLNSIKKKINFN